MINLILGIIFILIFPSLIFGLVTQSKKYPFPINSLYWFIIMTVGLGTFALMLYGCKILAEWLYIFNH